MTFAPRRNRPAGPGFEALEPRLLLAADLTITAAATAYAAAGADAVTVDVTVANSGDAAAETDVDPGVGAWAVSLYISADDVFDPLTDTLVGSYAVTSLASGADFTDSITLTAPAAAGTYTLFAVADADEQVAEDAEDNNASVVGTLAVGPDLAVQAAGDVYETRPGQSVVVPLTVENLGLAPALTSADPGVDTWTVSLWRSADDVFDPAADAWLGWFMVTTLAGGGTLTQDITFAAPAAGTYTLFGVADWDLKVTEADETNNEAIVGTLLVGSDLTIQAAADTFEALVGAPVTVSVTVENEGAATAVTDVNPGVDTWTVALYISADGTFDALTDTLVGSYTVTTLAPGGAVTQNIVFNAPAGGTYTLFGVADSGSQVTEPFEANNVSVLGTLLVGADLVVLPGDDVLQAAAGASVDVTVTVENTGAATATADVNPGVDAWTVALYLSADDVFDPAEDTLLGSYTLTTLAGGATASDTITFNAPAAGVYTLFGVADSGEQVAEDEEVNNASILGTLEVGPDLVIDPAATVYRAAGGGMADVTVAVSNIGADVAETDADPGVNSWLVSLYVSADGVFDPGTDTFVGSYTVVALEDGASVSQVISFAAPGATGVYTLFGVADSGGQVAEIAEGNNAAVVGTLLIGPDLIITADDGLYWAAGGQAVNVPVEVANIGAVAARTDVDPGANTWTVSLYLSADGVFNALTDTLLGSYTVVSLAGGATTFQTISFVAPAGTAGYTLFAVADSGGAVTEVAEDNNVAIVGLLGVGPDLVVQIDDATFTGAEAVPGESSWVTVFVTNAGAAAVNGWTSVQIFASADGVVGAGDFLFGQTDFRVNLAPGQAQTIRIRTQVPADIPAGAYTLLAVVDPGNTIAEGHEGNNTDAAANPAVIGWRFGSFDAGHTGASLTIQDADGNIVTFWMSGGWGEVTQGANGLRVVLYQTTAADNVSVSTRGGTTRIESFIVDDDAGLAWDGSLGSLRAPSANLVDDGSGAGLLHIPGTAGLIWLNNVVGGEIQVGAPTTASQWLTVWLANVTDLGITSGTPLAHLYVKSWADTDLLLDIVTAPSIHRLVAAGNADGMNLALTGNPAGNRHTLALATVYGNLLNATWDIGGTAGRLRIRGTVINSELLFDGDVRRLVVGALNNSDIRLATLVAGGANATLYQLRILGAGGIYTTNSLVAAWNVWRMKFFGAAFGTGTLICHDLGRVINQPAGLTVTRV